MRGSRLSCIGSCHFCCCLPADINAGWGMSFDPEDFTKFKGYECPANTYGELPICFIHHCYITCHVLYNMTQCVRWVMDVMMPQESPP
jgi:hypothetical protein